MTLAIEELGGEILLPEFLLHAGCTVDVQRTLLKFAGCKNAKPYRGFQAGELYVSDLVLGTDVDGQCQNVFGFRRVTEADLDCIEDEPVDFNELPDGDWQECV